MLTLLPLITINELYSGLFMKYTIVFGEIIDPPSVESVTSLILCTPNAYGNSNNRDRDPKTIQYLNIFTTVAQLFFSRE